MPNELTYYQQFQLRTYGNILPEKENEDFEDGEEDLRLAEFMETMNELQRMEDENQKH